MLGNFFKWDPDIGQNLLIKADLFLAIDRVKETSGNKNFGGKYILNVLD